MWLLGVGAVEDRGLLLGRVVAIVLGVLLDVLHSTNADAVATKFDIEF